MANDALRELLARDAASPDGVPEDAKPTPTIYPGASAPPVGAYIPKPDWFAIQEEEAAEAAERRRQAETRAAQDELEDELEGEREPPPQPPARKWRRR